MHIISPIDSIVKVLLIEINETKFNSVHHVNLVKAHTPTKSQA